MATHKNIVSNIFLRLLVVVTVMATLVAIPAWAGNGAGGGIPQLSGEEITYLNFVREEEKLARDVYLLMYMTWDAKIFSQIVTSEQQHMDTMLKMLDKYGLPDPASTEEGIFNDKDLQDLYDQLKEKGLVSYIDGLEVGVTIEVTDIADINEAIDFTDHVDLLTAYGHLIDGSYNHLAAFCDTLEKQGVTCDTQDIDPALSDAIMEIY
jgi:hypothetical protein